jgi:alkanesulfonate monooxygenase SsuD/methylene tetrahydromethanopterin reductase-like flavin-dependent oxidoreductase (luciferase family)
LGSVRARLDRWEEALDVIVSLLTRDEVDFTGRYYTLRGARCDPKPIQRPHPPICIGAQGERRGLRIAAKWAQHWNFAGGGSTGPAGFAHKAAVLSSYCAEIGRDPKAIRRSVDVYLGARSDPGVLQNLVPAYADAGVDLLIIGMAPPYDAARLQQVAAELQAIRLPPAR